MSPCLWLEQAQEGWEVLPGQFAVLFEEVL